MSIYFDPQSHLVAVNVLLKGPERDYYARLALDTGATYTMISKEVLELIGYNPDSLPKIVNFTTGSGMESASSLRVNQIEALGQKLTDFPLVAFTLPPSALIDGLLGLDFFRGRILTIDFQKGEVSLQ